MSEPTLESDRALLEAFRRGEPKALARVVRMYLPDVARALRAGVLVDVGGQKTRVGKELTESEVEVLTQETFVRAFSPFARQAYDGVRPFGAYLLTIARNLLIDHGRKKGRRPATTPLELVEDDLSAAVPPCAEEAVESEELLGLMGRFRAGLCAIDQRLFTLRYDEQRNLAETARLLGVSEIQVRRRDTRIRSELLQTLRSVGFLEHAEVRIGQSLLRRKGGEKGTRR